MTTPPILSASAPMISRDTPSVPGQAGDGPAFRDVLASQPARQAPTQAAAPQDHGNGKSRQASDSQTAASGKTAPAGKKNDDGKTDAAGSDAFAQAASLPDIALYIAGAASAAALAPPATQATAASDGAEATPAGTATTSELATATAAKPAPLGGQPEAASPGLTASLALPGAAQTPGADTTHAQTAVPSAQAAAADADRADHKPARQAPGGVGPLPLEPAGTHATPASAMQNTSRTPPADTPRPSALSAPGPATPGPAILAMAQAAVAQPSAAMAAPANTAATTPSIPVPFQSPQWGGELGRQFVTLVQSGQPGTSHIAQLRLDPPNLGPLHVAIHVSDNIAQAVFVSPHAQVRQAVENALPQLQQQLAQAGIALGQASVSDQGAPHHDFGDGASSSRRSGTASLPTAAVGAVAGRQAAAGTRSPAPNALVDTFA